MKQGVHPNWYPEAKVTCACGNSFITGSTMSEIRVEICSSCHPFFTGQQKFVDSLGQVERFQKRSEEGKVRQAERIKVLEAKKTKIEERKRERPSLKDLLLQARKQVTS